MSSVGADSKVVVVSLRDEPPRVARGTVVEIEVMKRGGPAEVYANLLALSTADDVAKVFAALCLLEAGHERYRCGREGGASYQDTGLWAGIARLQQLAATMLDDYWSYSTWPQASLRAGKHGCQARVLRRLVSSLRETMLNLLRNGVANDAPVWKVIDSSFADVVQRCDALATATDRLITEHRKELATLRFLSMDEYQAARARRSRFTNHDDYQRAMSIAKKIGLNIPRLVLGLYQDLGVVALLKGVKR